MAAGQQREGGGMNPLPADVARCPGVEYDDGHFREGCETCLRRTDRSHFPQQVWMAPPAIIAFFCEALIEPGDQT